MCRFWNEKKLAKWLFSGSFVTYQNDDNIFSGFFIQFLAIFQVARQPGKLTLMVRFEREPDQNRWPLPVVHWKPMEMFQKVIQVSSKLAPHTMVWFHENFSDSGKNWKIIKLNDYSYGLRTPNKVFFLKSRIFGLWQTNWTYKFVGIFFPTISNHFGIVSHLSIFFIIQSLFLQKPSLYIHIPHIYLGFGPQRIGDLAFVCP